MAHYSIVGDVGYCVFQYSPSEKHSQPTNFLRTARMKKHERNTTICISEREREKINEAAIHLFNTSDVPYATTVMRLIDDATNVDVTDVIAR